MFKEDDTGKTRQQIEEEHDKTVSTWFSALQNIQQGIRQYSREGFSREVYYEESKASNSKEKKKAKQSSYCCVVS